MLFKTMSTLFRKMIVYCRILFMVAILAAVVKRRIRQGLGTSYLPSGLTGLVFPDKSQFPNNPRQLIFPHLTISPPI